MNGCGSATWIFFSRQLHFVMASNLLDLHCCQASSIGDGCIIRLATNHSHTVHRANLCIIRSAATAAVHVVLWLHPEFQSNLATSTELGARLD